MKRKFNQGHAGRLEIGRMVLVAAESLDTSRVAERLAVLAAENTQYAAAIQTVAEAQAREAGAGKGVEDAVALVDAALDRLIAALVVDGVSYREPLAAYGTNPSALKAAALGEKTGLVTKLLAAVQRDAKRGPAVGEAVTTVAEAVAGYEERRRALAEAEEEVRGRRVTRDVAAARWEEAFARLKRSVKVAEDDGAAGLYAALFDRARRPATVRARSAPKAGQADAA